MAIVRAAEDFDVNRIPFLLEAWVLLGCWFTTAFLCCLACLPSNPTLTDSCDRSKVRKWRTLSWLHKIVAKMHTTSLCKRRILHGLKVYAQVRHNLRANGFCPQTAPSHTKSKHGI